MPRGLKISKFRNDAISVNNYLGDMLKPGDSLLYLKPSWWTLPNGDQKSDFYCKDGLHLIEGGHHQFSIYIRNILSLKPTSQSSHLSSLSLPGPATYLPIHVPSIAPMMTATSCNLPAFYASSPKCRRRQRRCYQSPPPSSEDEDEQKSIRCASQRLKFIDFRLLDQLIN